MALPPPLSGRPPSSSSYKSYKIQPGPREECERPGRPPLHAFRTDAALARGWPCPASAGWPLDPRGPCGGVAPWRPGQAWKRNHASGMTAIGIEEPSPARRLCGQAMPASHRGPSAGREIDCPAEFPLQKCLLDTHFSAHFTTVPCPGRRAPCPRRGSYSPRLSVHSFLPYPAPRRTERRIKRRGDRSCRRRAEIKERPRTGAALATGAGIL